MGCFCKKVRTLHCKVVLLDEQELVQEIQENSPGHEVLDTVFRHLNLLETAYFGLRYLDTANQPHWLDPTKKVARELKGTISCTLYFGVKFYAADPCKLLEEITRYQFYLQVKQDILQGRLPVNFDLAAELGAYVVQSELGDYDPRRHSPGYVSEFRFVSNQSVDLENRIAELHKGLLGQLPADAELAYLDRVKWLDMYGVDLHPVLGEDNVEYFLGLTPSGIIVLRNKNKVGNYYWPRITKIYFKGRYFMLRVCDKSNEESTYGFETPSRSACKQLWKCCVEHHAFFRLVQVSPAPNDIFRLSSRFRYSGRTEKQARSDVEAGRRAPPTFERSPSRRQQRRVVEVAANKWQGRRVVEGASHTPNMDEVENRENVAPQDKGLTSLSPTTAVPATAVNRRPSPPLSTRSAPWAEPHARGLYSTAASASPRSLRSAASTGRIASQHHHHNNNSNNNNSSSKHSRGSRRRSSSVESHSSTDSRPCRRHRRHRSRKGSDSESEVSKCSERCHSRCRNRHHRHKSRHSGSRPELVDSTGQWREVQRRQGGGGSSRVQQATVVSSRRSGYANSGADTETADTASGRHKRRLRTKHRSRSRSPSDANKRLPDELKQHLDFDLIDTEGMSEAQLREIPYTVIQTNAKPVKVKMSPGNRRRGHHSSRRSMKNGHDDAGSTDRLSVSSQPVSRSALSVPPLPFSPSASSLLGAGGSTLSLHPPHPPHPPLLPTKTALLRGNHLPSDTRGSSNTNGLTSPQQGSVPPRVPSAMQLNGSHSSSSNNNNNNLSNHQPNQQQQHHYQGDQSQMPKYLKSYHQGGGMTQQLQQLQQQHHLQLLVKQQETGSALDGVTSFMSNGNRQRGGGGGGGGALSASTPSPRGSGGSGSQSPYGNRHWDEGKSSGSRCSSGRGGASSSASSSTAGGVLAEQRGSPSSCRTPPLPPIVTAQGVTFQGGHNNGMLFGHRRHPHWNNNNNNNNNNHHQNGGGGGGDGRVMGRRGPLYYQQQQQLQLQRLQQQQQQHHISSSARITQFDGTSVKAVKTAARVENAVYASLQKSEPLLNGNQPPSRPDANCRGCPFPPRKDANSETCTEL